jgi:hypothetical protein
MSNERERLVDEAQLGALLESRRDEMASFDVFFDASRVVEVDVDGTGPAIVGPATTKLTFYKILDTKSESGKVVEIRQLSARLTLPTANLVEFATKIVKAFKQNPDALVRARESETKKILGLLEVERPQPETKK